MKKACCNVSSCILKYLFGGDEEDRTPDLRIANATLSQLSYVPIFTAYFITKSSYILTGVSL